MINCEEIVCKLKENLTKKIEGKHVGLAIIQVGNNGASNNYVKGKMNDCKEVGITSTLYKFVEGIDEDHVLDLIADLNSDKMVDGIIVQLPLPDHLDEKKIVNAISPEKDVDGFRYDSEFIPCTPKGVLTLLNELNIDVEGKNVCLVGYGKLVNKPLMDLLSDRGATVTVCRSKTTKATLERVCFESDIIVTATGRHGLIDRNCVNTKKDQVIIDCGITVVGKKQYGDCDEIVYKLVDKVTPRIKGMGLFTRYCLLENTIEAAGL